MNQFTTNTLSDWIELLHRANVVVEEIEKYNSAEQTIDTIDSNLEASLILKRNHSKRLKVKKTKVDRADMNDSTTSISNNTPNEKSEILDNKRRINTRHNKSDSQKKTTKAKPVRTSSRKISPKSASISKSSSKKSSSSKQTESKSSTTHPKIKLKRRRPQSKIL